ncbi:hypothetical protein ATM97_01040 [Nocardia sp. MH4]|nr:hypothetical protein [Nocardia sp. MH4]
MHQVVVAGAEHVPVLGLPLGVGHQRQCPEIGPTRHLIVELVEDQGQVGTCGELTIGANTPEAAGK